MPDGDLSGRPMRAVHRVARQIAAVETGDGRKAIRVSAACRDCHAAAHAEADRAVRVAVNIGAAVEIRQERTGVPEPHDRCLVFALFLGLRAQLQ